MKDFFKASNLRYLASNALGMSTLVSIFIFDVDEAIPFSD